MREPAATVCDALTEAHKIFAEYLQPGHRNAEDAMNKLIGVLDDERVIQAWSELERTSERDIPKLGRLRVVQR